LKPINRYTFVLIYIYRHSQVFYMAMNLDAPKQPWMYRANIALGIEVGIVLKKDQRTGKLTRGKVMWILTSSPFHSRGIKVTLESRQVGRVQAIYGEQTI
jgi:uncharacterized repeat protein (TIGR03833 family)